jgi:predicted bacteriocin transport accessory protein
MLVAFIIIGFKNDNEKAKETDAVKFNKEYTSVSKDNVFVYKTAKEIIEILEKGTGVVYLGFPECAWCQAYTPMLNDVAKQIGVKKIYYFDIKEDRTNNTSDYKKIVSLLGDNLANDEEGNKRIYVPDVTFVKDGVIIGHNNETSYDTLGFDAPGDYWTVERMDALKTKLRNLMTQMIDNVCETCNS